MFGWCRSMLLAGVLTGVLTGLPAAEPRGVPAFAYRNFESAGRPVLIPAVQSYQAQDGTLILPARITVSLPRGEELIFEQLAGELERFPGHSVAPADGNGFFRFELTDRDVPENPEGYTLRIGADGVKIASRGSAGLFYGAQTLRNIIRNAAEPQLKFARIDDWPDLKLRGYFFNIHRMPPADLPELEKMINVMAGLKLNWLTVDFGETFPYANNPYTKRKNSFTLEQVRELADFCRKRHIELTPGLQVFSHAEWMTYHPDWEKMSEGRPRRIWHSQPCILDRQARELTEEAIARQIEICRSKYFVAFLDEIYLGPFHHCPRCKPHDADQLLAEYVRFVEKTIRSRGATPVLMQDSFVNDEWSRGDELRKVLDRRNIIAWWSYADPLKEQYFTPFVKDGFPIVVHGLAGRPENMHDLLRMGQNSDPSEPNVRKTSDTTELTGQSFILVKKSYH